MLREFITEAIKQCTSCKVTAGRLTRSILLDIDYEIAHPSSEFSMKTTDFENPSGRIEHLFLGKHLGQVDTKKMERVELITNLWALSSYRKKYKTDKYDQEISLMTSTIAKEPIIEIDSLVSVDKVVAQGIWFG